MSRWSLQPSACLSHPLSVGAGPEWWLEDFRKRVMDEIATIVAAGAVLGALAGWIGPGRWRWQLLRLVPLLLVPFALYILATRSWIFGGGGPLVEHSLLVVCGSLGYLPAVLATMLLRWVLWRAADQGLAP